MIAVMPLAVDNPHMHQLLLLTSSNSAVLCCACGSIFSYGEGCQDQGVSNSIDGVHCWGQSIRSCWEQGAGIRNVLRDGDTVVWCSSLRMESQMHQRRAATVWQPCYGVNLWPHCT